MQQHNFLVLSATGFAQNLRGESSSPLLDSTGERSSKKLIISNPFEGLSKILKLLIAQSKVLIKNATLRDNITKWHANKQPMSV